MKSKLIISFGLVWFGFSREYKDEKKAMIFRKLLTVNKISWIATLLKLIFIGSKCKTGNLVEKLMICLNMFNNTRQKHTENTFLRRESLKFSFS